MRRIALIAVVALVLASCGGRSAKKASPQPEPRPFPEVSVPSVYTDQAEILDYLAAHYWDAYLAGEGKTGKETILGVGKEDVERHMAAYVDLLDHLPLEAAQKSVGALFRAIDAKQDSMPEDSLFYLRFSENVARYLYDPNSPYRNEDLFLPFVQGLAASHNTREDLRAGYEYQARMCAINRHGEVAPDFRIKDARGRIRNLHGVKAEYILLFFSNPGCDACKSIIDDLTSRPYLDAFIAAGTLAVVNVYIDEDISAWKAYEPVYPRNWVTGYEFAGIIREEQIYDVRAIPSLYLLDREYRIVMKDAPTERVLAFLDRIAQEQN